VARERSENRTRQEAKGGIMSNRSRHYIGITLTFATRTQGELALQEPSFLARASTFSATMQFAKKIGIRRSWGNTSGHDDFVKCLGLNDVFAVVGPMGHGALMGQTSKFGYKTLRQVQRLLAGSTQYVIDQEPCEPAVDDFYIARLAYFLGAPIPYKSRRALVCWGIVKSTNRSQIVDKAIKLAQSSEFKKRIVLRDYEEEFPFDPLEFVGVNNIIPLYERLRVGNYFLHTSRKLQSVGAIDKLALPNPSVFKTFFMELPSWYETIDRRLKVQPLGHS
jgi:hypothetical protein